MRLPLRPFCLRCSCCVCAPCVPRFTPPGVIGVWTNRPQLLTWQFRGSVPLAFLTLVLAFEALVWQPSEKIAIAIATATASPHAARMLLNIRRLRKPCTAYEARRRASPRRL